MRILVVEDDKKIASFVQTGLRQAGLPLRGTPCAANGDEGLHLALTVPYDAAVVDVMLPIRDGLSMIEQIRQRKINTPVIL